MLSTLVAGLILAARYRSARLYETYTERTSSAHIFSLYACKKRAHGIDEAGRARRRGRDRHNWRRRRRRGTGVSSSRSMLCGGPPYRRLLLVVARGARHRGQPRRRGASGPAVAGNNKEIEHNLSASFCVCDQCGNGLRLTCGRPWNGAPATRGRCPRRVRCGPVIRLCRSRYGAVQSSLVHIRA